MMHQERDGDEVKDDNTMLQDAVNVFMSGDAEVDAVATALRSSPPPTQLASCKVCTPTSWKRLLKLQDVAVGVDGWRWLQVVGECGWMCLMVTLQTVCLTPLFVSNVYTSQWKQNRQTRRDMLRISMRDSPKFNT